MSNEHYDAFCEADLSSFNLTQLELQVFGHYCTRFNPSAVPPKAWPPVAELERITGTHPNSISRALGHLVKKGLLIRVTYPKKGTPHARGNRAEFAINVNLLKSHNYLTDGLSEQNSDWLEHLTGQTAIHNPGEALDNPGEAFTYPMSYAKPNKPINLINVNKRLYSEPLKVNVERWLLVSKDLPKYVLDKWTHSRESEELLTLILEQPEMTLSGLRKRLGAINFGNSYANTGLLLDALRELVGVSRPGKSQSPNDLSKDSISDQTQEGLEVLATLGAQNIFKTPEN